MRKGKSKWEFIYIASQLGLALVQLPGLASLFATKLRHSSS